MPINTTTTWNPSDKGANITLSNGNLSAAGSGSAYNSVRATTSRSAGKFYWENVVTATDANDSFVGFGDSAMLLSNRVGLTNTSGGIASTSGDGLRVSNMTIVNNILSTGWAANDVMNFTIDLDAGKFWVGKNGTWTGTGNPATGANPNVTFTANLILFPAWSSFNTSNTGTARFNIGAFTGTVPAGFLPWDYIFAPMGFDSADVCILQPRMVGT